MNKLRSQSALLFALSAAAAAACTAGSGDERFAQSTDAIGIGIGIGIVRTPPPEQSFLAPASWSKDFASSTGWNPSKHVRLLADIDHDGKKDIVAFGDAGVYVARSLGTSFEGARFVIPDFGTATGWTNDQHVRTMADVNGDGRADIVAFGYDGVWTALSNGASFDARHYVLADFGTNQGWSVATHVRTMADVNGDGRADIVGYKDAGVYVSLATGDGGFGPASFVVANFGASQGWDSKLYVRTTGDVDGDGRADLVAFGYDGVWTALSTSVAQAPSFAPEHYVLAAFGGSSATGSWTAGGRHERRVVDIDGDHKADIVGFGENGTYVAHATGDGGFGPQTLAVADFGFQQMGYALPAESARFIDDFNADGRVDIVGYFNSVKLRRSVGGAGGTFFAPADVMTLVGNIGGQIDSGDVDGDGKPDLVGYTDKDIMVERSTASPKPPPPAAPSNAQILSATASSIFVGWNDNSSDEVAFGVAWTDPVTNAPGFKVAPANAISNNVTGLRSFTRYCFTVESIGWFGNSAAAPVCGSTLLAGPVVTVNATTHTSLGFSVQGTSAATELRWHLDSGADTTVAGNTGTPAFTGLAPGSNHCLHAQQLVGTTWSVETETCASTSVIETGTTSMALKSSVPYEGYVVYVGTWNASSGTITGFTSADNLPSIGLAFIKPSSYTGGEVNPLCGDPSALIYLGGGGTLTASQVAQVSWPGQAGQTVFYACGVDRPVATYLFTNVNWQK